MAIRTGELVRVWRSFLEKYISICEDTENDFKLKPSVLGVFLNILLTFRLFSQLDDHCLSNYWLLPMEQEYSANIMSRVEPPLAACCRITPVLQV